MRRRSTLCSWKGSDHEEHEGHEELKGTKGHQELKGTKGHEELKGMKN